MAAKIPFGSIEFLHVPITRDEDSAYLDLTTIQAEVAILGENVDPALGEVAWHIMALQGDADEATGRYLLDGARPRGRYTVWTRITTGQERALRKAGLLTIT